MSEDSGRGRRLPSREHSYRSHSDLGSGKEAIRPRNSSGGSEEEPKPKIFKKESDSYERNEQQFIRPAPAAELTAVTASTSAAAAQGVAPSSSVQVAERAIARAPNNQTTRNDAGNNRRRNNRFDVIRTRPNDLDSKLGSTGNRIKLQANYFRMLTTPNWRIYQYHVTFLPNIELRRVRGGILSEYRNIFGGYVYDDTKLFSTNKLREAITKINATSKQGDTYEITIKFVGEISMVESQALQVLNLLLRRSMEGLKLQLLGRNLFDPVAKVNLREYKIELWPGYQTSIRQHEKNILLCAEITHKTMRTETLYEMLKKSVDTSRDYQEEFRRQVLGLTVLTDYNNKTYKICDVDFNQNPTNKFKFKNTEISFCDYYNTKYNLRIRDTSQPLLLSKSKDRSIRGGQQEMIVLIPELCRAAGITDSMRNDMKLMRAMSDHTRLNPDRRIQRLMALNQRLQTTEISQQVLRNWNMTLDKNLLDVDGRVIDPQKVVFSNQKKISVGEKADWTGLFRTNPMFTTPSRGLTNWYAVATNRNSRDLRNFIECLIKSAKGMSMNIAFPQEILIQNDRGQSYVDALESCCRNDPQIVLCMVPNNNSERYALIKKKSFLERSIPTQVITQKSASNPRGLMSIATKVAIQINCKMGYTPWMVEVPLSGLMTMGFDIAKSSKDRTKAYGALVASMDLKMNATFFSTVTECKSFDSLSNNIWPMMIKALRQYQKEHKVLPTRIIFYRDGVSEGSLQQVCEQEVKEIVEKLQAEYDRQSSNIENPKSVMLAYIIVNKSVNTRFFARGRNPSPGTIVDDVVTLPERYDFYLVSQSVRQGTVSPTSYNVIYSNIRLSPDQLQLLTYKMCHLYYNWSGTTRVPAVCQYAKKLASLVAVNLFQPPQGALDKKLYYL